MPDSRSRIRALRVVTLRLLLLIPLAFGSHSVAAQPNVLYIVADDQRSDTVAALAGNTHISTPNLDALAASGFAFNNAYNFGANSGAICQPSRAMFLTGRTLWHVNTGNLSGATTMPEAFGSAGYTTFGTGKWHNDSTSFVRSFDQGEHIFFGGCTGCSDTSHTDNDAAKAVVFNTTVQNMNPNGTFTNVTPGQHGSTHNSTLFADATVDFIATHTATSSDPFFAYLSFTAPHDPRVSPEPYASMYRDTGGAPTVPVPVNFLPQHSFDQGDSAIRDEQLVSQPTSPWPRTEAAVQEEIADYYAMITHMDAKIGRVLRALEEIGELDDTIVVFHADHGLAVGSHGLMGKQNPYEHSIKAPLIISGPGISHGSSDALVYLHDIFPTVASSADVSIPAGVEGHSLTGILAGAETEVHDAIFNTYKNFQKTIRQGDWKLIYYPHIDRLQLFQLADDPDEMNDLSGTSEYSMLINELAALMRAKQVEFDDPNLVDIPYQGLLGDIFPDGLIDVRDWRVYRHNFDEDLAGLTFLAATLRGDLDGDLDNDVDDFSLFKSAFNEANGAGAFEEMVASVPEPSTIGLLLLGSLMVVLSACLPSDLPIPGVGGSRPVSRRGVPCRH
jgi:arylsulfatase A-like enzyme